MFVALRKRLMMLLASHRHTSVMIGSHINGASDERSVALRLCDGWYETAARLSPEGARAISRQLEEWAAWAEKGNATHQWQSIIRYKTADAPEVTVETAKPKLAE